MAGEWATALSHMHAHPSPLISFPSPPPLPSLPLLLSPSLTHTVPHYLRTKLDLDLEARQQELEEKVKERGEGLKEDIKNFNKMIENTLDRVNEAREELEEQRAKAGLTHDPRVHLPDLKLDPPSLVPRPPPF